MVKLNMLENKVIFKSLGKTKKKSRTVSKIKKSSWFGGLEGQAIAVTGMDSEKNGGLGGEACSATRMESHQTEGLSL